MPRRYFQFQESSSTISDGIFTDFYLHLLRGILRTEFPAEGSCKNISKGFVSKILKIRGLESLARGIIQRYIGVSASLHSRKENWTAEGQRNYEGCTFISLGLLHVRVSQGFIQLRDKNGDG